MELLSGKSRDPSPICVVVVPHGGSLDVVGGNNPAYSVGIRGNNDTLGDDPLGRVEGIIRLLGPTTTPIGLFRHGSARFHGESFSGSRKTWETAGVQVPLQTSAKGIKVCE